ncbi:MAG: FKBP-type peptidyl-prolyl cis-trans isomerase [Prevotellaceae bacterium]|jgi:hypothetical protein|nr:FKBP-type peptidyl-prolyl cis-trans isomerase [Prevotellaceae bacterium]
MKLGNATVYLTRSWACKPANTGFRRRQLLAGVGLIIGLVQLAFGAKAQAYTPLSSDIRYCIYALGAGNVKIDRGCYVRLSVSAATQQGAKVFERVCWLPIGDDPSENSLEASLMTFSRGDSVGLIMPARILLSSLISFPKVKDVTNSEPLRVNIRVLRVVESDIILDDGYKKFCADYLDYEKRLTNLYLRQHADFKKVGDIWKKRKKQGNGKKPEKFGDVMHITYEGFFLNGAKFDSNGKDGQPFRYVRGQQWQLVAGLVTALASMSEGESATFIVPSPLAFGAKGLADIVPPFTPVIYEIEVQKVTNANNKQ